MEGASSARVYSWSQPASGGRFGECEDPTDERRYGEADYASE
jgi:hypothetical protein